MSMDQRTREALEASIAHWRDNVAAETPEGVRLGISACALCGLFWTRFGGCEGCPVAETTRDHYCGDSPYGKAESAHSRWEKDDSPRKRAAWRKAAQAELDFLISLRPSDEEAAG